MGTEKIIKSSCGLCFDSCGILIHLVDDKPVKVKGDPDSAINEGALCIKGLASLEYLNHPGPLKISLKAAWKQGRGRMAADYLG